MRSLSAGRRWPRSATDASALTRIARHWRRSMRHRSNGVAACAAMRIHPRMCRLTPRRPARACLSRPHRPAASAGREALPAGQRAHGEAVRRFRGASASRGWSPAICASRRGTRSCCAPRRSTRHTCGAFAAHFHEGDEVRWDAGRRALASERIARFDGIVLSSKPAGRVDPALAARALTDAVRDLGLTALPWTEALSQWRVRVQCLRAWMPELGCRTCRMPRCWPRSTRG
jgi:ATP-dependent helicase HrpB